MHLVENRLNLIQLDISFQLTNLGDLPWEGNMARVEPAGTGVVLRVVRGTQDRPQQEEGHLIQGTPLVVQGEVPIEGYC